MIKMYVYCQIWKYRSTLQYWFFYIGIYLYNIENFELKTYSSANLYQNQIHLKVGNLIDTDWIVWSPPTIVMCQLIKPQCKQQFSPLQIVIFDISFPIPFGLVVHKNMLTKEAGFKQKICDLLCKFLQTMFCLCKCCLSFN